MKSKEDQPKLCPNCGVVLPDRKINMCGKVVEVLRTRPDLSYREVAEAFKIAERTVKRYAKRANIKRRGRS